MELREAQSALLEISNKEKITPAEKRQFDALLAKISLLKSGAISDEVRKSQADSIMGFPVERLTDEQRSIHSASMRMRDIARGASAEYRTYSPWDNVTPSGAADYIPTQFEQRLVELQMAAGPLYAGSPAVTNVETSTGAARQMPMTDDTASTGYVQTQNGIFTEAEVALAQVSMGTKTFSSGFVQYSVELAQDVASWGSLEKILTSSLAKRLSRIQNSTFLATLLTTLASNSSASVAAAGATVVHDDITNLVGSVNAQYRYSNQAGFLMNSGSQKALANLKGTDGLPIFRHVLASKPTLLDYPVYVSDFADPINTSGKKPILFGDWSYVFLRHIPGIELQKLQERYVDQFSDALVARKRADMQYACPATSDSAIKMLSFA
jgi:HK97 family phage major capsid protein